jgi:RNA polymerase sigma-70 factor (ECF subfamily)
MPENSPLPNFDLTVLPHLGAAYKLARGLTRNKQDAEDLVQEACLRAFRFFAGFHGSDARAWMLTIVRNTCFTWLQANRASRYTSEFDERLFASDGRVPDPETLVLRKDNGNLVRHALENLPPNFRQVLILREIEGMSYREIAAVTGLPAGTVMSSLARARVRLHHVLTVL